MVLLTSDRLRSASPLRAKSHPEAPALALLIASSCCSVMIGACRPNCSKCSIGYTIERQQIKSIVANCSHCYTLRCAPLRRDGARSSEHALRAIAPVTTKMAKGGHGPAGEKLPAEGIQARRFGKTRSARSTALLEDYVELIADLLQGSGEARPTDIARRLGVSHATAIKTIKRLKRAGLATARPYRGVFLTEKGEGLAERVRIRHRLWRGALSARR